jgi:hypothetical protein
VADDAGALLVRSGLVASNALEEARARVASGGGTLGEQLVVGGAITDEALTEFFRSRLLVPQVNPNLLARLTAKVVATISKDMAIELRAIPVSLDGDNNLTVAMSDPSDRHAVDEIAFFTGAYVVRAVATQMQIAWCLAHYYGHVTALGQRLLHTSSEDSPLKALSGASSQRVPRTKGLTGKVDAARHRAIAPITGPVNVVRPNSGELDLRPLAAAAEAPPARPAAIREAAQPPATDPPARPIVAPARPATPAPAAPARPATPAPAAPVRQRPTTPAPAAPVRQQPTTPAPAAPPVATPRPRPTTPAPAAPPVAIAPQVAAANPARPIASGAISPPRSTAVAMPPPVATGEPRPLPASTPPPEPRPLPASTPPPATSSPAIPLVPRAAPDAITLPPVNADDPIDPPAPSHDAVPDRPRARSVSGEIRVPSRRAPSIRPPMPAPEPDDDDDDEPLIVIERGPPDEDATGPRQPAPPRRRQVKSDPPELYARAGEVDLKGTSDRTIDDEPRIVIDEDAFSPPTGRIDARAARDDAAPTALDDLDTGAVIHDRLQDAESAPILLEQPRSMTDQIRAMAAATLETLRNAGQAGPGDDDDTGEVDIVVLDARKPRAPRPERNTQHGVPPAPGRTHRDTEASGVPAMVEPRDDRTHRTVEDPTTIDLPAAPSDGESSSDQLAAPPAPVRDDDTNPHLLAPPPAPARPAATVIEVDDDDEPASPPGPRTSEMSTTELAAALADHAPAHLGRPALEHDPVDDGWGPPGTTIPPPLLGAIPGSDDDDDDLPSVIPMPSVDSSPLIVGPRDPSAGEPSGRALVRALEDATARAIDVLRTLERAESRDEVVAVMVDHLAETHHRAGFFVTRPAPVKGAIELSLFTMKPHPPVMPFATLRLDRPSTLQDVVGTRLPYRGPMHDDASRTFLVAVLGACPAEILLVPVAVRERVVGVLFGEHRHRHTFDDQLALAARAAGMALERILKAKRS